MRIARGRSPPLGASAVPDGVNFSLLSRDATAVHLLIFLEGGGPGPDHPPPPGATDREALARPRRRVAPAFGFAWRVEGPKGPWPRLRPSKLLLLDPARPCSPAAPSGADPARPRAASTCAAA
ncbi:MAG: hypothetical protein U0797_27855 [Gemmataceae bacterium]